MNLQISITTSLIILSFISILACENDPHFVKIQSGIHKTKVLDLHLQESDAIENANTIVSSFPYSRSESRDDKSVRFKQSTEKQASNSSIILARHLQPQVLIQVSHYLRVPEMILVTREENRDTCLRLGTTLLKNHIDAVCMSLYNLSGYYSTVVLIANENDGGRLISSDMKSLADDMENFKLQVSNIVVILFWSATTLQLPNRKLRVAVIQSKGLIMELKEVITFGPGSLIPVEEVVGWWVPDNLADSWVPYRRDVPFPKDFRGNTIRIAVIQAKPYIMIKEHDESVVQVTGYMVDILHLLQKYLNFTIEWVIVRDGHFGMPLDNGNFTGVVGVLQRKEADIGGIPLTANIPRLMAIDFSPPVDFDESQFLIFRNSEKESIDWWNYLVSFHWSVWITLICIWAVTGIGLIFVASPNHQMNIYNNLFSFFGILAQQGSHLEPHCARGRMVFFTFWIGSLLLYTTYTAMLTSRLAVLYRKDPFSSLKEAITSAGYFVAVQDGSSYITVIEHMRHKDEGMKLLYQELHAHPEYLVKNIEEGLSLIQKGKIAFLCDVQSLKYETKNDCSYSFVGPAHNSAYVSLGYTKNLTFSNAISQSLIKLLDSGITQKLKKKWWGLDSSCDSSTFQEQGFSKTISAFALLAGGILLGIIFLIAERYVSYCVMHKRYIQEHAQEWSMKDSLFSASEA